MVHPFRESARQSDKLERRSCRGCHQRKIRCDRKVPCTNCSRCGISCVYPTKDKEKGPSLQHISSRLERLEGLLARFVDRGHVNIGPATADRGRYCGGSSAESQNQVQGSSGANANTAGVASGQHSNKSTWEILLNDGQGIRDSSNPNIEILLRDVSLLVRAKSKLLLL